MAQQKIQLVVDPSKRDNNALERIGGILKRFSKAGDFEFVTLLTTNLDGLENKSSNVTIDQSWFDSLTEIISSCSDNYSIQVAWARDWADTVIQHIEENETVFSILPFYDHRVAHVLSDQKWKFLRNTKTSVLLTNGRREHPSNIVLAAIKVQDPDYEESNKKVLKAVNRLAEQVGSEVHVVNAYSDSMNYPDRAKILDMTHVENDRIHVEEGSPINVLRDFAEQLDADAIYISNHQRQGITGSIRGNTVEKILEDVECDIVMV